MFYTENIHYTDLVELTKHGNTTSNPVCGFLWCWQLNHYNEIWRVTSCGQYAPPSGCFINFIYFEHLNFRSAIHGPDLKSVLGPSPVRGIRRGWYCLNVQKFSWTVVWLYCWQFFLLTWFEHYSWHFIE